MEFYLPGSASLYWPPVVGPQELCGDWWSSGANLQAETCCHLPLLCDWGMLFNLSSVKWAYCPSPGYGGD